MPYSFHRRGVALGLVRALPPLVATSALHVMFPETWSGGEGGWRSQIVGAGQRWCAVRIGRASTLAHTSNRRYRGDLAAHGVTARLLPLFGSIPIAASDATAWLMPALAQVGCDDVLEHRRGWWVCALFGTLHPVWPPEPLLGRLLAAAAVHGKRVALVSIGRIGSGASLWLNVQTRYRGRIPMLQLGEQPENRVSELLNTVDFGIATTPLGLLDKSAAAAAMFEHGLPVIVNREDVSPSRPPTTADDNRVIRLDAHFAQRLAESRRHRPARRVAAVAEQFLDDLDRAAPRRRAAS